MSVARSRKLVQRSRQNEDSPAPSRRPRDYQAPSRHREAIALPPYEPPSCPLSATARRELDALRVSHEYAKYARHVDTAKHNLPLVTGDVYDRLRARKELVEKERNKRQKNGGEEKSEAEIDAEERASALEAKAKELTERAEKAMRDIVDYRDELAVRDGIMRDVSNNIPPPPASQPARMRPQADDENGESEDIDNPFEVPDVAGVSTIDLLKEAKAEYARSYTSKSMRERYENTDYATFKRTLHIGQCGEEGPPLPPPKKWFTEDGRPILDSLSPGQNNANGEDGSDDDVMIARATVEVKCPLTLQYFKEPYSNKVCKHTFEKTAILDYHRANAAVFPNQRGQRGPGVGPKVVKCPQTGCNALLRLDDFYVDSNVLRRVKRAQKEAAREDDEDEDDDGPRGTQRNNAQELDSEMDIDAEDEVEETQAERVQRIKRERAQSQGYGLT